ncbi:tetratricopeptide repeat protein [Rhodopirellula sp. JC740]|uniref:Tetratricopeptide repeat protein n=1 Tax=Rhodopirellula halodulae TaxID=2894198 RepID=A0ABS8NJS1_9BACT|nr:tetratricopeptide repeat protein [Rhodopirellula sp. JC740]
MKVYCLIAAVGLSAWFWTPDQLGQRLLRQNQFAEAATAFETPMWQGVAWYRAGEFEKAAQSFSRASGPDSKFNLGNCWLMRGKYDKAIASYDEALKERPNWKEAQENRDLAEARMKATEAKGGDAGDQRVGADEVVFDKDKQKQEQGQDTDITAEQAVTDSSVQAVWLHQVQTQPADFLKSKFRYQLADREKVEQADTTPTESESSSTQQSGKP